MSHPGGRPTKLTPALIKKAQEFVAARRADRMLLPTVEGLALELGISRETVYEWSNDDSTDPLRDQFSYIVSDLKAAQGEKLMQYSLAGKYNATIAKLILSGKHGYVEKSEVDQNVKGDVTFINDVPRPNDKG